MATRLESAIARVIAEGKCAPTKNMSGRRDYTDSPHHGGQAVARAAKIPLSTSPKPLPITPVREPETSASDRLGFRFALRFSFIPFRESPQCDGNLDEASKIK